MTTVSAIWEHVPVAGVLEGSTSSYIAETFSFVLDACSVRQVPGFVAIVPFSARAKSVIISRNSMCKQSTQRFLFSSKVASIWITCHIYTWLRTAGLLVCVVDPCPETYTDQDVVEHSMNRNHCKRKTVRTNVVEVLCNHVKW